jgi:hypothetical protein
VLRAALALVAAAVALAFPLSAGSASVTGEITLRAQYHHGPWKTSLSFKLVKIHLTAFTVCGIWNHQAGAAFDCENASHDALPAGTTLRLEQSPIARALKRSDSPGWGMLGASPDAALGAVLSNLVSGNRRGTFHYRVTLRDTEGHVLVTSNAFTVVWR